MNKSRPDEVRAIAAQIVERATHDADYMDRLRDDPEDTLRDSGLPDDAIATFIREAGITPEVGGYILEELDRPCQMTVPPLVM